jgi:hypothetical protein
MKVADPRNPLSPPVDTAYSYDPNTGISYVQRGGRFYRMNGQTGEPIDGRTGQTYNPQADRRTNTTGDDLDAPTPSELQMLAASPYETVPAGYANGGMTYAQAFEKQHGYLPADLAGHISRLSAQQQPSGQNISIKLPSGRVVQLPPGAGAAGSGMSASADSDYQDQKDDSSGE